MNKKLEDKLKELSKKYGTNSVKYGNQVEKVDNVISTGSLSLDIELGIGGIAVSSKETKQGKIYELIGWESSGKSTLTQTIIGNAQKKKLTCLLVDGEASLEPVYANNLGINLDDLLLIQLDEHAGEGAYDKMFALIESGEIDLVIIDSYNSLQPRKIVDDELEAANMGLHARMMGKVVMKANAYAKTYGTTFIFIGQLRKMIGQMYGSPDTGQANNSLKFYAHVRMEASRSTTNDNTVFEGGSSKGEKLGNLHKIHIVKNKMGAPFRKVEYNIIYGVGIDKYSEIVDLAHKYELGKKWGTTFTYKGVKHDLNTFMNMLKEDSLYDELRESILKAAFNENKTIESEEIDEEELINSIVEKEF